MLVVISGISGSGKSTIGEKVAEELGWSYLDMDTFYLQMKPIVRLSTGETVTNWDTLEAIDVNKLKERLRQLLERNNVLFTGFAPDPTIFPVRPTVHIHLGTGRNAEEIIERSILSRRRSKGFTGQKAVKDERMVREIVYPFYEKVMNGFGYHDNEKLIYVYNMNGDRKNIAELVQTVKDIISKY